MKKRCLEYTGIFCCLFFSLLAAFSVGRYIIPFKEVCGILISYIAPVEPYWTDIQYRVVTLIRIPRVLGAGLAGATLAMAGAALQGILKNPLVSPQVIGVSTGAAFGGVLAILLFESSLATMGLAYAGGLLSLIAVWVLCNRGRGASPLSLVLGGIIINAFFTALISLIEYVADPYDKLPAIVVWLMGSFASLSYDKLFRSAPPLLLAGTLLWMLRFRINVLSLGSEEAQSLGIDVTRTRWLVMAVVAMVASATVAMAGVVGWIGLVVPHITRMFVGNDHKRLIPLSCFLGGMYTILVDTLARTLVEVEIPMGVLTALVGTPLFAFLMYRLMKDER
ncbi:MAG: iron ABC transporter permease [Synergistaceae bacterium]|jgi:iron complex transport system permease protein|nr:iron ABC transporter permease [Synergistaceae bacterium]